MRERESGYEALPLPEHNISPAMHAFLEYKLLESEQRLAELEDENKWLRYDQLTGVLVAKVIRVELDRRVERAYETGEPFALIFGDVDNMKGVNTVYGYTGGDSIISAVGRACRRDDIVGRAGGDELWWLADLKPREDYFVARAPHFVNPTPEYQAALMARSFERRANEEIKKLNFGNIRTGFSVGISVYHKGDTAKDLISRANQDMVNKKEYNKSLRASQAQHPSSQI